MGANLRNSKFVKREVQIALREGKRIIPIMVGGEKSSSALLQPGTVYLSFGTDIVFKSKPN
jgi:hypothetical protein